MINTPDALVLQVIIPNHSARIWDESIDEELKKNLYHHSNKILNECSSIFHSKDHNTPISQLIFRVTQTLQ